MTTTKETPSVSGLLPLKLSGRHYGDNLARLDLLLSSLLHFGPDLLDELIVVARADEADRILEFICGWPELPLRLVIEDEYFPAFRRFSRPWQIRPWQRQQVIKLNAPAITTARYVLTLDPDVLAVRPIGRELLLPGGRALLEPEARSVHRRWWRDSADLLDVDPRLDRPGMNVTPALLSTAVLDAVHQRLETVGGRPWMDVLLTSYCDWTEYTLYLLVAEELSLLPREHLWADEHESPARLHAPALSVWGDGGVSGAELGRRLDAAGSGLFAVVQSSSGLPANEVAVAFSDCFPVRSTHVASAAPAGAGASRLHEQINVASRLAAQEIYRARRSLRRLFPRAASG